MLKIKVQKWTPSRFLELGWGGEAVVYKIRTDTVAKVFHLPTASMFKGDSSLQEAAKIRLREMQKKLFHIPSGLPVGVVVPNGVLVNMKGRVFGYTMPYIAGVPLEYWTRTTKVDVKSQMKVLANLHDMVSAVHAKGCVMGDLNENNVLIDNGKVYLIDVDSMQFGDYQCRALTLKFTAPELIQFNKEHMNVAKRGVKKDNISAPSVVSLVAPHTELTDWYSFLVIAMRVLTSTDPYGGTIGDMEIGERIARRITIFDKRVKYPAIARPLKSVPRNILEVFFRAFHGGERFIPQKDIFNQKRG